MKKTAQVPMSIDKIREKIQQEQAEKSKITTTKTVDVTRRTTIFNQQDLTAVWGKIEVNKLAGNNQFFKMILEDGEPVLSGKHAINVTLHNQLLKEHFVKFKPQLYKFLSEALRNDMIHLDAKIEAPKIGKKRIYTSKEKFDYLAKLNPSLITLKKQLGLDFED